MKLNKNSWLVRYAYLASPDLGRFDRENTNLCRFFWRCVLLQPLKLAFATLVIAMVAFAVWLPIKEVGWLGIFTWPAILLIAGLVLEGPSAIYSGLSRSEVIQTIKGNYCPKIDIS